jgi:hypothetical protein
MSVVIAQNLIYKSLRLLGVLASGEAPTAAEAQDSLYSLNSLIDAIAANPQYYYTNQDEVFATRASQSIYAIGNSSMSITTLTSVTTLATATTAQPHNLSTGNYVTVSGATPAGYNVSAAITVTGPNTFTYAIVSVSGVAATGTLVYTSGDFYTQRPIRIVGSFVRTGSGPTATDTPLGLVTEQFWNNISNKASTAAVPTTLVYRPTYPFGEVILYPAPAGVVSLHLKTELTLVYFSSLTDTQYMPPGYQRMLELSLAVELAPEYGSRAAPETLAYLKSSLADLMRTNMQKLASSKIGAIPNPNVFAVEAGMAPTGYSVGPNGPV